MARFAIIDAGRVSNIIEADSAYAARLGAIDATGAAIGDLWDGEAFSTPAPTVIVPESVTMRQARLALHSAGLLAGVDAAIASLSEPAKTATKIEWEYAQTVDRASGLVPQMATALGMTERQIDDLFTLAGTL